MNALERSLRRRLGTLADVDDEIDLLKLRRQQTCDDLVRSDCDRRLAVCQRIRDDMTNLSLFPEVTP